MQRPQLWLKIKYFAFVNGTQDHTPILGDASHEQGILHYLIVLWTHLLPLCLVMNQALFGGFFRCSCKDTLIYFNVKIFPLRNINNLSPRERGVFWLMGEQKCEKKRGCRQRVSGNLLSFTQSIRKYGFHVSDCVTPLRGVGPCPHGHSRHKLYS